ncbi:MAG TPA: chemotaxis-specific protein-glutamate methyltransferase CheB [Thermoanaerobaculia bacterium]|nr:chemotaxis-specific protein-glutamate methyltransferase CheB [Thermoanaerobaculia bacterium]
MSGIRVAVADDSSFLRRAVARMLAGESGIELVGSASRGEELLDNLDRWRPDAVILDLSMPGIGGLATLDEIMVRRPVPVVILSTYSRKGAPQTIEALHRGAVDFLDKQQFSLVDFDALRQALVGKIREVTAPRAVAAEPAVVAERWSAVEEGRSPEIVLIGASTGGPPAIERILRDIGGDVPMPILVVQHMPAGFTRAFAERLNIQLPLEVREPVDGELLQAATVYIAPGGFHLRVTSLRDRLVAAVGREPEGSSHRPSVDVLFASVAEIGTRAVAVLLTGMGQDGASGMARLAERGALTIAQDEATSTIFGMPRAAAAMGGVREMLPLPEIGTRLRRLWSGSKEDATGE